MGMLSRTTHVARFRILGEQVIPEHLMSRPFRSIADTADEKSTGFVQYDNHDDCEIVPSGDYLPFAIRTDTRKVPGAALKQKVSIAEKEWLEGNPTFHRVPKSKKVEIRDAVHLAILAKLPPVPAVVDAVIYKGELTIFTSSQNVMDSVKDLIRRAVDDSIQFQPHYPFRMALDILPEAKMLNKATTENVLDEIMSNRWLGQEFLLWLLYRTAEGINTGDILSYFTDKLILVGRDKKKIVLTGELDQWDTIQKAITDGYVVSAAKLYIEDDYNNVWSVFIDAEMFYFRGYTTPSVMIEKRDDENEAQAVFFERMFLLEKGQQLFSQLFAEFLVQRVHNWAEVNSSIQSWLENR